MDISTNQINRNFLIGSIFFFILITYLRYGFVVHFPNDMVFFYVSILENTGEWKASNDIVSLLNYNEKTIFFNLLSPFVKLIGLQSTALITDLFSKIVYFFLLTKLALELGLRDKYGFFILFALASCVDFKISTAGIYLWDVGMIHRSFALMSILASILLLKNERFIAAGGLVGVAISLHAFSAIGGLVILLSILLMSRRHLRATHIMGFGLASFTPVLLMLLFKTSEQGVLTLFTEVSVAQKDLMIERQHYLFMNRWSFSEWVNLATTSFLIPLLAVVYTKNTIKNFWMGVLVFSWAISVFILLLNQVLIEFIGWKFLFLIKPGIEIRLVFFISMILIVIGFVDRQKAVFRDVLVISLFFSWFLFRNPTLVGIFASLALLTFVNPSQWHFFNKLRSRVGTDSV